MTAAPHVVRVVPGAAAVSPKWDQNQCAIFAAVAEGTGHIVVNAVAGSGKTTTIIEALKHVNPKHYVLYLAFATENAADLRKAIGDVPNVDVRTTHSYGRGALIQSRGQLKMEPDRIRIFCRSLREDVASNPDLMSALIETVKYAKNMFARTAEEINRVIDEFGIHVEVDRKGFVEDVLKLLERSKDTRDGQMTFEDMIWLPVVENMTVRKYDRVFVDETQDLNPTQILLTLRSVKEGGRVVAVGDPNQAIYRFRGADKDAFARMKTALSAAELPLSVSYRCCHTVVRLAQTIVPAIKAAPGAVEGMAQKCSIADLERDAAPGDLIVSRTNAPLASLCRSFLEEGIPAYIMGKNMGAGLLSLIKKMRAKSVEELRENIKMWVASEQERLLAQNSDIGPVWDRARCVLTLSRDAEDVYEVEQRVRRLFHEVKDDKDRIVLGTTHKAKGKERDRVWVLDPTYRARPGIEEDNLYYVAVTRAKRQLFIVTDYPNYDKENES